MTPYGRDDAPRPFTPAELDGADDATADELVALTRVARELEATADRGSVRASADFADRVMRSIAAEPSPAPVRAAGAAVRRHSLAAMLGSLRDAVRVAFGAGFPIAIRAQALALVLVVSAVLATGSGMATVGAVRLLGGNPITALPNATEQPPTPDASELPEGTLDPAAVDGSPEPSEPGEPSASEHPNPSGSDAPGTPEATDNSGGNGGNGGNSGNGGNGGHSGRPTIAPSPSDTAEPTESDHHGFHSPRPSDQPSSSPSDQPVPFPSSSSTK